MNKLIEKHENFGVDDSGDVVPLEDYPASEHPASNAFKAQGLANIEKWQREQVEVDLGEEWLKREREKEVAALALENAGVYVTLDEHRENLKKIVDIASDLSMYRGGEKGGYKDQNFQGRYQGRADTVESGARRNHRKIIHEDLPKIYKAKELIDAKFDEDEVMFDAKTKMRLEIMQELGGPNNKNKRAKMRKDLNK